MKTLVLDIGGIFFRPSWRLDGIAQVSQVLGVSKEEFKEALGHDKKLFYTGKMSEKDYWGNLLRGLNVHSFKSEEMEDLYRSYVQPIPETLALLPELSSRYKLVTCNNCPKEWMDYRVSIASLDKFFFEFFTSGYIGSMKPEGSFYSRVFSGEGPDKEDMVYIDDNEEYVSLVQKQYGIQSLIYKNLEDLQFWIR